MDIQRLELKFDDCLNSLFDCYKKKGSDYFFTEKEIHSYFYHLCQCDGSFEVSGFGLIHTEYPTPFKCRQINTNPYIVKIGNSDIGIRAHLDLVLINPNFIEWVEQTKANPEIIYGLGGKKFENYMPRFKEIYDKFTNQNNEPILLAAVEFKFYRHAYDGIKSSLKGIIQDSEKLKLLIDYKVGNSGIPFVKKVFPTVFIGKRCGILVDAIDKTVGIDKNICKVIIHKT